MQLVHYIAHLLKLYMYMCGCVCRERDLGYSAQVVLTTFVMPFCHVGVILGSHT